MIPVDFSINTEMAVEKALAFANAPGSDIHFLHVGEIKKGYSRIFSRGNLDVNARRNDSTKMRLQQLVSDVAEKYNHIHVHATLRNGGNVEKAICEKAAQIKADLVIIGKSSGHWIPFFNTVQCGRLAKNTGIPVLTVKPGSINQEIRTVVIPVEKQFSQSKISGLVNIVKKTRIQICLLAFAGKKDRSHQLPAPLLNSYRFFKKNAFDEVSFNIIREQNKGKAVLNFCKNVNADLLIVNPETETGIGWFNEHISDALPAASKTQILAV